MATTTQASKNIDARAREARATAIRDEERRLSTEREGKKNAREIQRRTEAVERDERDQRDAGPKIVIEYGGQRVTIRPGVLDTTARLSAVHVIDVLVKAIAYHETLRLTGRRQNLMAGRVAGVAPTGAWTDLLQQSDMLNAAKFGLVVVEDITVAR
jgi:hypothetical protein